MLTCAGLVLRPNPSFDGKRYPLVMPKKRVKGITYGPNGNKLVQDADMEGKVIGGESFVLMIITMMIAKACFALYRNHLFHVQRQFLQYNLSISNNSVKSTTRSFSNAAAAHCCQRQHYLQVRKSHRSRGSRRLPPRAAYRQHASHPQAYTCRDGKLPGQRCLLRSPYFYCYPFYQLLIAILNVAGAPCDGYDCERRVAAIIARETGLPVAAVGRRPWPATSTLPQVHDACLVCCCCVDDTAAALAGSGR